jgi:hypothetical protein
MKRAQPESGTEPSFDETLLHSTLKAPLAALESMLDCGGYGSAVFDFPMMTGTFAVEGCTGSYTFCINKLEFSCEPEDDYKGDPHDTEPFLDFVREEEQRKRVHWRSVCAVARAGKSWTDFTETEHRFPRPGRTVAVGNGTVVRMVACNTSVHLDLYKGTVEERKAKRAAKQAAKKTT